MVQTEYKGGLDIGFILFVLEYIIYWYSLVAIY